MADITRRLFLRQLRGTPTTHITHLVRGRVKHRGTGLTFWFRPLTAVLSEVPVDDRELPLLFHARTSDFQDVTVQATVTYRITGPDTAATRMDFSIDPTSGVWRGTPLDQLAGSLAELAQQPALDLLAGMALTEAVTAAVGQVRERIAEALAADGRLAEVGVEIVAVRVVAVRPEPELERALQTPTREAVQADADRATYERRALAVERERAIAENELQSKIELARRTELLVAQDGANARRQAEENAAADQVRVESEAAREQTLAGARAEARRLVGAAEAEAEQARLAAFASVPPAVLYALAARELAAQLPEIGQLTVTPDLVTGLLNRLALPTSDGDRP
jgi:regulator of protease activity HflC (stomatin/prohibitin superfamily)